MPNKPGKPTQVKKKKIFCIRVDETYLQVMAGTLDELVAYIAEKYMAISCRESDRLDLIRKHGVLTKFQNRLRLAMDQAKSPRRTSFSGVDRAIAMEANYVKRVKNEARTTESVPEYREARRRR